MKECHDGPRDIWFTNICGVRMGRSAVLKHSSTSPLSNAKDCAVSDWAPDDCSVPCDDTCSHANVYECGGCQTLRRDVVVANSTHGYKCPAPTAHKRCNQIDRSVDCVMSQWTGWSAYTKECEKGVESRARDVITVQERCQGVRHS